MKTKKIYSLFYLLTIAVFSFLSINPVTVQGQNGDGDLSTASFVFKGTVASYDVFKMEGNQTLYVAYSLEIETIYKGGESLEPSMVQLIAKAPDSWELTEDFGLIKGKVHSMYASNFDRENAVTEFELGNGVSGVFACNAFIGETPYSLHIEETNPVLSPVCNTSDCFFLFKKLNEVDATTDKVVGHYNVGGFGKRFGTFDEFNNYLKDSGLTIQKETSKKKVTIQSKNN